MRAWERVNIVLETDVTFKIAPCTPTWNTRRLWLSVWLPSSFQTPLCRESLNLSIKDTQPPTLSACFCCSPPFYLSVPVPASIFLTLHFLPFQLACLHSLCISYTFWHNCAHPHPVTLAHIRAQRISCSPLNADSYFLSQQQPLPLPLPLPPLASLFLTFLICLSPHSLADTHSDCYTGRLQKLLTWRWLWFVTVFKRPNRARSEMFSWVEHTTGLFFTFFKPCTPPFPL